MRVCPEFRDATRERSARRASAAFGALLVLALSACATLPTEPAPRADALPLDVTGTTTLGLRARAATAPHGSDSGIRLLDTGHDAFLERAALIEAAERSIDAQYYIWNSDTTGRYMAARLLRRSRTRRARAPAAGRHQRGRARRRARAARPAPEHRDPHLQSRAGARRPALGVRVPARVLAAEPPHAQQVLHGGRQRHHPRRTQHRRRVFRRARRAQFPRPRRGRDRDPWWPTPRTCSMRSGTRCWRVP